MDGWRIYIDDGPELGQPQAKSVSFSTNNVTEGKQCLAVNILPGFRKGLRTDELDLAPSIKGHKLAIDVTAPQGLGDSFFQVTVAAIATGMEWHMVLPVDVPADGKPHTVELDTSTWPIPADPEYFTLWLITNTKDTSRPETVYLDNLQALP
jgi:hypothetical protein